MFENNSPIKVYQKLIDDFVEMTNSNRYDGIVNQKSYSHAKGDEKYNEFLSELNESQRKILVNIIDRERESVVHDILAELTWWIDCEELTICHRGIDLPKYFEGGLHYDYIGRINGWKWPE